MELENHYEEEHPNLSTLKRKRKREVPKEGTVVKKQRIVAPNESNVADEMDQSDSSDEISATWKFGAETDEENEEEEESLSEYAQLFAGHL